MANKQPITGKEWSMSVEGLEVGRWTSFTHTIARDATDYVGAGEDVVEGLQGPATITASAERGYMNVDLLKMIIASPSGDAGSSLKRDADKPNKQRLRTLTLEKRLPDGTVERVTLFDAWFPNYEWSGSSGAEAATESLEIRAHGIEVD